MVSVPSHGVVAKTAWRGIRCSSVLKSNACKFSEEKTNQIVVTLCKCICLETLIFANLKNDKDVITFRVQSCVPFGMLFCASKIQNVTIVFSGISISYLIKQ